MTNLQIPPLITASSLLLLLLTIVILLFTKYQSKFTKKRNNEPREMKDLPEKVTPQTLSNLFSRFQVPKHIAVIMDGNRRFGREKHSDALQVLFLSLSLLSLPPLPPSLLSLSLSLSLSLGLSSFSQGHWHGGQTLVDFVQWCMEDGIEILTVYAFSTENWKREATEVNTLMVIISKYADSFKDEAITKNIRVKILATGLWTFSL
jgi:undecaprenyl pyrophosphate synthase